MIASVFKTSACCIPTSFQPASAQCQFEAWLTKGEQQTWIGCYGRACHFLCVHSSTKRCVLRALFHWAECWQVKIDYKKTLDPVPLTKGILLYCKLNNTNHNLQVFPTCTIALRVRGTTGCDEKRKGKKDSRLGPVNTTSPQWPPITSLCLAAIFSIYRNGNSPDYIQAGTSTHYIMLTQPEFVHWGLYNSRSTGKTLQL